MPVYLLCKMLAACTALRRVSLKTDFRNCFTDQWYFIWSVPEKT